MNYRFQKITTIYPEFVQPFLSRHPDYNRLSYEQFYDRYIHEYYGWADYYSKSLKALGNEAQEVWVNFEHLQKLWAKEHDVRYTNRGWLYEIVLAQVAAFQPSVIFLEDTYVFDQAFRQRLREACKGPVIMIGWLAAPTHDFMAFKDFDLLMSCAPHFVESMRQTGTKAELLYHAFEPAILDAVGPIAVRDVDFSFVGSLVLQNGFHNERYSLMERLMETTPLQVWGQVSFPPPDSGLGKAACVATYKANRILEKMRISPEVSDKLTLTSQKIINWRRPDTIRERHNHRFHSPVFGLSNFKILGRSRITLNKHIDCAENYAGNARLFEATGMGACLLTDWKLNLAEIFEPDLEVVAYKSPEECIEKASYLIEHEKERQAIAAAGQRRIMRDHTYAQRALQLNDIIQETLSTRS